MEKLLNNQIKKIDKLLNENNRISLPEEVVSNEIIQIAQENNRIKSIIGNHCGYQYEDYLKLPIERKVEDMNRLHLILSQQTDGENYPKKNLNNQTLIKSREKHNNTQISDLNSEKYSQKKEAIDKNILNKLHEISNSKNRYDSVMARMNNSETKFIDMISEKNLIEDKIKFAQANIKRLENYRVLSELFTITTHNGICYLNNIPVGKEQKVSFKLQLEDLSYGMGCIIQILSYISDTNSIKWTDRALKYKSNQSYIGVIEHKDKKVAYPLYLADNNVEVFNKALSLLCSSILIIFGKLKSKVIDVSLVELPHVIKENNTIGGYEAKYTPKDTNLFYHMVMLLFLDIKYIIELHYIVSEV